MEQSFPFGAQGEDGLQVLWEDGDRVFCRGWREDSDGSRGSVLVVLPAAERPPPASLARLANEYELRDELDAVWAARPLTLAHEGGRTALLLEDPGGEPRERLIGAPMKAGRFLRLAIGIAAALGEAHQRSLVHKDVKPANILVNCADGLTRLTGFGIASRLPRERQAPEPPEVIAGTLAYMAPEQTGRMNRSIDSRSDPTRSASRSIRCSPADCLSARPIRWNGSTAISPESRSRLRNGWRASRRLSPRS